MPRLTRCSEEFWKDDFAQTPVSGNKVDPKPFKKGKRKLPKKRKGEEIIAKPPRLSPMSK